MNKTALITGASKRIGKSLAEHLAANGWNIIIHYNSSGKHARELASALNERYPDRQFKVIKTDLSNTNEVEKFTKTVLEKFGKFGLLINNASVFDPGYVSETSSSLLNSQLNVNLKAPFLLMRDFKKYCGHGNIINIVDTRITTNKSNYAAYTVTKKALWELTKMAALEFAPGIRVNAIAPGATLAPIGKGEEYLNNLAKKIPMQKPGGFDPILKSLDYILANSHLTGQLMFADGGENLGTSPWGENKL